MLYHIRNSVWSITYSFRVGFLSWIPSRHFHPRSIQKWTTGPRLYSPSATSTGRVTRRFPDTQSWSDILWALESAPKT